jgi:hypothetical protein
MTKRKTGKPIAVERVALLQRKTDRPSPTTDEEGKRKISKAVSRKAERRGLVGGDADLDWLETEKKINDLLEPPGDDRTD